MIASVQAVLEGAGVDVRVIATESPESAGEQAQQAIADGCDTVLACGGDGTVHEAMQRMVGGAGAIGVIPLGTANALAMDLGLPGSPAKAAKMLLAAEPVRVGVGRIFYQNRAGGGERSRYFVVAAGVGVDGLFFSRLDTRMKQRFGYLAYLIEALKMAFTHTFPMFVASFLEPGKDTPREEQVSQILAVRISNFGGLVQRLAPGAALGNDNLHVIAFKTRSRARYMRFMIAVWFRRHRYARTIELVDCSSFACRDLEGSPEQTLVEADGELLGVLPMRVEVVPQALTLLIPRKRR